MLKNVDIAEQSRQSFHLLDNGCISNAKGEGVDSDLILMGTQLRIANALEAQTDLLRGSAAGFTLEQQRDAMNHLHMVATNDSRLIEIKLLATSPEMALKLSRAFGDILKEMVDIANEELGLTPAPVAKQEGGQHNE